MRIGAYQSAFTGSVEQNLERIRAGAALAAEREVRLLLLPECALTGYPADNPHMLPAIDFSEAERALLEIEVLSRQSDLYIVFGTVERAEGRYYNSAFLAAPGERIRLLYRKRALWGWDADHFSPGDREEGMFEVDGVRVGVRICYEIRFPEYFRELYRKKADCAAVLFNDVSRQDATERYALIRSHILTRAVENVFPIVAVNSCASFQTAPTVAADEDGRVIAELPRHAEGLLVCDLESEKAPSFGARGRKHLSDRLAFEY